MHTFERNLGYFQKLNPRAAALLSCANTEHLQFCHTQKGELNLVDTRIHRTYHDPKGALDEAIKTAQAFKLPHHYLCIYGVGLGFLYQALSQWLHEDERRLLIILEDDLAVISRFLETKAASELLLDKQVFLYYFEHGEHSEYIAQSIAWITFSEPLVFYASPVYRERQAFEEIEKVLLNEQAIVYMILGEYEMLGCPFFCNFWQNLRHLPHSYNAADLFRAFKGIPAYVMGAGPSLTKQLPLLRTLSDRALLIAGGSAMNIACEAGLQPHFGGGVDPNPTQYLRLRQSLAVEMPFFYKLRVCSRVPDMVMGTKFYLKGDDAYGPGTWFDKTLRIRGKEFEGGYSIANTSIALAHALGCNPIILVGFDLALTEDRHYAKGVEHDEEEPTIVAWKDYQGKPTKTLWKWVMEAEWISDFCEKHPSVQCINATEGGLWIPNVTHMPLQDAAKKWCKKEYDMQGLVHMAIQNASPLKCTHKAIQRHMGRIVDSLKKAQELLEHVLQDSSKVKLHDPFDNPDIAALFYQLQGEPAFLAVLQEFYKKEMKRIQVRCEWLQHPGVTDFERNKAIYNMRCECFECLLQVTKMNISIIAEILMSCTSFPAENSHMTKNSSSGDVVAKRGVVCQYFDDGKLASQTEYAEGRREGEAFFYSREGICVRKATYTHGVLDGKQYYYYPDGVLRAVVDYKNGELDGEYRHYYPNGKIMRQISCQAGKRHGLDTLWEQDGQKQGKERFIFRYEHGVLTEELLADRIADEYDVLNIL